MLAATDPETTRHSQDVELLVSELCTRLGIEGEERKTLLTAARLHDVGKVAVPQEVLEKREPLDASDWKLIKQHTVVGERMLESVPELAPAAPLVRHSHENFDGSGYPDGLSGDQIPLGSRIILCADAFHAIRCDRPYRRGRSTKAALAEIKANAGKQFDPRVVQALAKSISSARRPGSRRMPRRVAVLFAALTIGTGGAYAAERGWVPSPIPGVGPESTGSDAADEPTTNGETPSAVGSADDGASAKQPAGEGASSGKSDDSRSMRDGEGGGARGRGGDSRTSRGAGGAGGANGGGSSGQGGSPGAGESSPGNSGSAPGQGGSFSAQGGSGNGPSGSTPGKTGSAPGQSGSTPGQSGSTPGQSGSTPGQSGSTPGSGASAPGQSGTTPGQSGSTPGQSGSTPGQSGSTPGQSGFPLGNSGSAPGQNKP